MEKGHDPETAPSTVRAEPSSNVHGEMVPPLPFESGDVLASEPLVPLTPESHPEVAESELPEPLHEVGTVEELPDFPQESGELDELLDWPGMPEQPASEAPVISPPPVGLGAVVESPPPVSPPTISVQAPATDSGEALPIGEDQPASTAWQAPPATGSGQALPSSPPAAPPPAINPMFGMSRDLCSFIGGLPLSLPELAKPKLPFSQVAVTFDGRSGGTVIEVDQPLIGAMDVLSSTTPTVPTPSFENYGGQVSAGNQTQPGGQMFPSQQPGTLEGWSELPDLVEPDEPEESEEITKAHPDSEQRPHAASAHVEELTESHSEELQSDLDEPGPEHSSEGTLEEEAFDEVPPPAAEPRRAGAGAVELPEFEALELSGLDAVAGAAGVELFFRSSAFHRLASRSCF